jgi:hypothetical protein
MQKRNKPTYEDLVEIIEKYDGIRLGLCKAIDQRWQLHQYPESPTYEKDLSEVNEFIAHYLQDWLHTDEEPYHIWEEYKAGW